MSTATWGVVATIKAAASDILNFAAHHLDLGAQRIYVYLDAPNDTAQAALAGHPRCRVTLCDDAYWKRRGKRPDKHQSRQTRNASYCYQRKAQVEWLMHLDVDELLLPLQPVEQVLAELPAGTKCARARPLEALAPDPSDPPTAGVIWFKGCARKRQQRIAQTLQIYPEYADCLDGGFLSHVQGKIFVRTGMDDISLRIHNAFQGGEPLTNAVELDTIPLCHMHAGDMQTWLDHLQYRLARGSYRASLKPAPTSIGPGTRLHDLLTRLDSEGGVERLSQFYRDVNMASPDLRARLDANGLLHAITLDLDAKRARHFPEYA